MHKKGIARTGRTHPTAQKIFGVIVLVCLLLAIIGGARGCNKRAKAKKAAAELAAQKDANKPKTIVPVERPWTFQTVEIPAEGIPIYLYQGWKDWPKNGPITITTPGGQVLQDQPGAENHFGFQPDGMYIFRADPQGSNRKVQ